MMAKLEVIEDAAMRWPDGCDRTRIKERKNQASWKFGIGKYREMLVAELQRMGATSVLISRHQQEGLDPGIAVWFSMQRENRDWQQGLGLDNPAPTLAQIDDAFRSRAARCHPDRSDGGDPELFKRLNEYRQQARAWVTGTHLNRHEYVMAIDQYNEARLNMCALRLAFSYIRGLERVGAPAILTQTLGAFRAKLTGGSSGSDSGSAAA